MNIAQSIKNYYESEDFKNMYLDILIEDFHNNEGNLITVIQEYLHFSYDFEKLGYKNKFFDLPTCRKFYELFNDFIESNLDEVLGYMVNYYVGSGCLASVDFGEQEEQLKGLYNHKTKKEYSLDYLQRIFEEEDFCVNGNYAYYNLSGDGIKISIDSFFNIPEFKVKFDEIYNNN